MDLGVSDTLSGIGVKLFGCVLVRTYTNFYWLEPLRPISYFEGYSVPWFLIKFDPCLAAGGEDLIL